MEAFVEHGVVKDVIDCAPSQLLTLFYDDIEVKPGMILTPTQVKNIPKVKFEAKPGAFYTLLMNDPDAPKRSDPKCGEWHHWLVINIPEGDVTKGEVMSEYVGAGPPKNTGLHRYVFLLYCQHGGKASFADLSKLTNRSSHGRPKHNARAFADKYNLGKPVAGTFFQAEYDNYVPKLTEQLRG